MVVGSSVEDFEDVCKTIKALVISRKEKTTLEQLRRDFKEMEGREIPYHKYGHANVRSFLSSMQDYVTVRNLGGIEYVIQIDNEKSAHISKLVAEQRSNSKKGNRGRRGGRSYRSPRNFSAGRYTQNRLNAEELNFILNLIKCNPGGIAKSILLNKLNERKPFYCHFNINEFESQLREMTHEISFENGNIVRPRVQNVAKSQSSFFPCQVTKNGPKYFPVINGGSAARVSSNVMPAGYEDDGGFLDDDEEIFESSGDVFYQNSSKDEHDQNVNQSNGQQVDNDKGNFNDNLHDSNLVSDRIKFRLEKLIQKHEDGIWCADLPRIYDEEYKVTLHFMESGFTSVREFAAYLKNIFVLEQPKERGDYKLYSIKTYKQKKGDKVETKETLASLHNIYNNYSEQREPAVPEKMNQETSKRLIPQEVLGYKESVGQVSVSELKKEEHIVVIEIFDPSFFWIRQLSKMDTFNTLMHNLGEFYIEKRKMYLIPPIVLEKGLNVACRYNNIWHRGIVVSIRPDNLAYILFYDYGTVKLVPTNELCFLNRKFSNLPALAIPCGMYNLQPTEGNRWSKWVIADFVEHVFNQYYHMRIMSYDEENNSAMVHLFNEKYELHTWMIKNNLAIESSVICKVDVDNLEHYEENALALRNFAGPIISSLAVNMRSQSSSPLPEVNVPLVSPQSCLERPHAERQKIYEELKISIPLTNGTQLPPLLKGDVNVQNSLIEISLLLNLALETSEKSTIDSVDIGVLRSFIQQAKNKIDAIRFGTVVIEIPQEEKESKNPFKHGSNPFFNCVENGFDDECPKKSNGTMQFDKFINKLAGNDETILKKTQINKKTSLSSSSVQNDSINTTLKKEDTRLVITVELNEVIRASVCIIIYQDKGWMLTEEFAKYFLNLFLFEFYQCVREQKISVESHVINKFDCPQIFKQLSRCNANLNDSKDKVDIISMKSILMVLTKFNVIKSEDLKQTKCKQVFEIVQKEDTSIHGLILKEYISLILATNNHLKTIKK